MNVNNEDLITNKFPYESIFNLNNVSEVELIRNES